MAARSIAIAATVAVLGLVGVARGDRAPTRVADREVVPTPRPPSRTMERAVALYSKTDYLSASIELSKVLAGETEDDAQSRARAEFFAGKTFYQLGLYWVATAYFAAIAAAPSHAYHEAALKWLVALQRVVPGDVALEHIGKYDPSIASEALFEELRDELRFFLGRYASRRGDLEKAAALFEQAPSDSEWYALAQAELAVVSVRQGDGARALAAVARAGGDARNAGALMAVGHMSSRLESNGDAGDTQTADRIAERAYSAVAAMEAPEALSAQIALRRLGLPSLGALRVSPAVFSATVVNVFCESGPSQDFGAELSARWSPMREALSRALDKYEDNAELREYIEQTLARPTAQQATTVALIRAAVGDRDSQGRLAAVVELDGELDLLAKTDRAWQTTRVAADALQELTLQQALAQSEAGLLYRQRITQLIAELDELTEHARASKFSIGPDADLPLGATTCDPTAATETGSTATTQTPAPPRAKGCGCRATDTGSGAVLCGLLLGVLALGRRRRRIPG